MTATVGTGRLVRPAQQLSADSDGSVSLSQLAERHLTIAVRAVALNSNFTSSVSARSETSVGWGPSRTVTSQQFGFPLAAPPPLATANGRHPFLSHALTAAVTDPG